MQCGDRKIPGPQQAQFCFWPEVAAFPWFPRLQDTVDSEEGMFNAHLLSTRTFQDHILQEELVSFAINPEKLYEAFCFITE